MGRNSADSDRERSTWDDYPHLAATWRSPLNDDPESVEADKALNEIARLRAEVERLRRTLAETEIAYKALDVERRRMLKMGAVELERLTPVVEAAKLWRERPCCQRFTMQTHHDLVAAVDALTTPDQPVTPAVEPG
jgi:hypothetical protein